MEISLDIVEKYGWTLFDFVSCRPKRFYDLHIRKPDRHLPPITFLAVTLLLFSIMSIISIELVTSFFGSADSPIQQSIEARINPDTLTNAYIVAILTLFFLELYFGKKYAELGGERATTKQLFIAKCYTLSLILILPAVQIIINLIYVLLSAIGFEVNVQLLGVLGMLFGTIFFIIFMIYNLEAMAAFNEIPFRAYLTGYLRILSAGIASSIVVFLFLIFVL